MITKETVTKWIIPIAAGFFALIFILSSLRPFNRFMGEIPYLISDSFNKTLRIYTNTRPSRQILIITGPFKSGKSRALNAMARELEESDHLVFNIDASRASNIFDFFQLFRYEIASSLINVRQILSSTDLKSLSEIDTPELNSSHPIPNFPDQELVKPYVVLSTILESVYVNGTYSEWAVHQFFDYLEKYGQVLQPAVFIHNLEVILSYKTDEEPELGKKIVKAAVARFMRRDLYKDTVPIFVEVKNSMLRVGLDTNIFRIVQTDQPTGAYNTFVRKYNVFRKSEFKKIENQFGLHIGTFSRIFEDLKYNVGIDSALQNLQDEISTNVHNVLQKDSNARHVANRLCKHHGRMRMSNTTEFESLTPLFENGYIYLKKGLKVRVMNKGVVDALCSI